MLKSETRTAYAKDVFELQKNCYGNLDIPEKDIRALLEIIDENCDFKIEAYPSGDKLTFLQRLTMCIVTVLYMPVLPFQWIFTGRTGMRGKNKFTLFILKSCGMHHE